jgi:CRP/FNR family cyclic AMP-dependent transcriptional regulator
MLDARPGDPATRRRGGARSASIAAPATRGNASSMEESRLRSVPLFAGLSRKELKLLSAVTDEVALPAGTHLIDEGTFSHEFLLITAGNAEVRRGGTLLATLGPGDFAGEAGAMHDARRNASVIATSDLTAIVMTARDLRRIAAEMESVGARIEAAIAARSGAAPAPLEGDREA